MTVAAHICTCSDGARIACLCVRGSDHFEDLFDVPVGEEPNDDEDGCPND